MWESMWDRFFRNSTLSCKNNTIKWLTGAQKRTRSRQFYNRFINALSCSGFGKGPQKARNRQIRCWFDAFSGTPAFWEPRNSVIHRWRTNAESGLLIRRPLCRYLINSDRPAGYQSLLVRSFWSAVGRLSAPSSLFALDLNCSP